MSQPAKVGVLIGTRPGIIKMAPVYHAAVEAGVTPILIHSGQHYSLDMDASIMEDVLLPKPDYRFLRPEDAVTHGAQTAFMLREIETALIESEPDVFLVCGDANTNLAGALAARKLGIALGHVEAGLRSHDWRMPEEHNRRMIDHISEMLFAPSDECVANLKHESVVGDIHCVGNTVVDSALRFRPAVSQKNRKATVTLHRQENVDDPGALAFLLKELGRIAHIAEVDMEFLVHPRTRKRIEDNDLWSLVDHRIHVSSTVGYKETLRKIAESSFVVTDSGGLQEEACILGTPCYTMRKSSERPETVYCGANVILGIDQPSEVFKQNWPLATTKWECPLGDGRAAARIVQIVSYWASEQTNRLIDA